MAHFVPRDGVLSDEALEKLTTSKPQEEVYDRGFPAQGSFGVRLSRPQKRRQGTKVFFLVYSLHGKRKRMTLGRYPVMTLAEARARALSVMRAVASGEDPATEWRRYRRAHNIEELCSRYTAEYLRKNCAPKTSAEYERLIRKEILPLWKDKKPHDIRAEDVANLVRDIASIRGKAVLSARVKAVATSLFDFAIAQGIVSTNPAKSIAVPTSDTLFSRILIIEEYQAVWRLLESEESQAQALFKLLILTAQRPGVVLSMRWSEIRMDTWYPKVPGRRGVTLPILLVPQAISALQLLRSNESREDLVFVNSNGRQVTSLAHTLSRLNARSSVQRWSALDLYRGAKVRMRQLGIRPDVIEVLQMRTKPVSLVDGYDYRNDLRDALQKWAAAVVPSRQLREQRRGKVISLF